MAEVIVIELFGHGSISPSYMRYISPQCHHEAATLMFENQLLGSRTRKDEKSPRLFDFANHDISCRWREIRVC